MAVAHRARAVDDVTSWALLAKLRQPQFGECVSASELRRQGLADGMVQQTRCVHGFYQDVAI